MPGGRNLGWASYGVVSSVKDNVKEQIVERFDEPRAIPLTKASNGYCPICGYWSISTGIIINNQTNEKIDKCLVCNTIFGPSGLEFVDSKICECGHPKEFHEKDALSCVKGKEATNCQCNKYRPTKVTAKNNLK
ncbi:MAG: hypothetical protein ACQCN3_07855 [Candidatus Bathyarchaeia archaeon]